MKQNPSYLIILVFLVLSACNSSSNGSKATTDANDSTLISEDSVTLSTNVAKFNRNEINHYKLEMFKQNGHLWNCRVILNYNDTLNRNQSDAYSSVLYSTGTGPKIFPIDFSGYGETGTSPFENFHKISFFNGSNEVDLLSVTVKPGRVPPPRAGAKKLKRILKYKLYEIESALDTIIIENDKTSGEKKVTISMVEDLKFNFQQVNVDMGNLHYNLLLLNLLMNSTAKNTQTHTVSNYASDKFVPLMLWNSTGTPDFSMFSYIKQSAIVFY